DEKEKEDFIKKESGPMFLELKEEALKKGWLDLKAVYGYFRTVKRGKEIAVLDGKGKEAQVLRFDGGIYAGGMSLSDYFNENDITVFQAVTVGEKIGKEITRLNEKKEVSKAFLLHGMSVHLAEAVAEYMHGRIRSEWGLRKEQGKRYSPGYPLWRDLSEQIKIFALLDAEKRIGVELTEGYQMIPEQSTTAMILHNDKAEY
ncbi:MAG: methionine synthase, partial [Candidatus Omnitrophica bacterium]|nr:methionine synthase [Candidatus Omnitrophota bacterium]